VIGGLELSEDTAPPTREEALAIEQEARNIVAEYDRLKNETRTWACTGCGLIIPWKDRTAYEANGCPECSATRAVETHESVTDE